MSAEARTRVFIVTTKAAHVIASALHGRAQYLITLDRKHLANEAVRGAGLPFQVMLPGEFLQALLAAS